MPIAWQEHDQDVFERLGVAGRAEATAFHGNEVSVKRGASGASLRWYRPLTSMGFVDLNHITLPI